MFFTITSVDMEDSPKTGPIKADAAKMGKTYTRSMGLNRSGPRYQCVHTGFRICYLIPETEPPAAVKGVAAKRPAMYLKASCAPIFGAKAEAMTKIMKPSIVTMYTGFRPNSSENGPVTNAPQPKAIRKRAVARDSVTSDTPKAFAACDSTPESTAEEKPTIHPIAAMFPLFIYIYISPFPASLNSCRISYMIQIFLANGH